MVDPDAKPIPTRRVLEAVLGILDAGAQWHMGFSLGATAKFCVKF